MVYLRKIRSGNITFLVIKSKYIIDKQKVIYTIKIVIKHWVLF